MSETIYEKLDRIEAHAELEPLPTSSLAYLQSVYRDTALPIGTRMRAAGMALPFEHPKLSVVAALKPNDGLAERLERAIARSLQNGSFAPRVIEGVAVEVPQGEPVRVPEPGIKRRV